MEKRYPSADYMAYLLKRSKIKISRFQLSELWTFHMMLRKNNVNQDLTRILNFESIVIKHYIDCMIIANFIKIPSPLLDIGTGAGFPGIPLKILIPRIELILAEARLLRAEFLERVCASLKFKNVHVFNHKVTSRSFTKKVSGVITRALEPMYKTMLRTSACLDSGGLLIFMKGPNFKDEMKYVEMRFGDKYKLRFYKTYTLPYTSFERSLLVYEKT